MALHRHPAVLISAAIALTFPLALGAGPADPYASLPTSVSLIGIVRDFREKSAAGGHADFERSPSEGFAHYQQQVHDALDAEGKPVFRSAGKKTTRQWRDSAGRNMMQPRSYISARPGDSAGSLATSNGGSITTATNFSKWFRDVPGVNMSAQVPLTLTRQPGTNTYTFNDRTDSRFQNLGGFFPINGQLLGNSGGSTPTKNFHFTFELLTQFQFKANTGQVFSFTGDDDVYVFIDNKLVIDLGGVHTAQNQSIQLDRLNWLVDGQTYDLRFFFAERHRSESNCRIDTNLVLRMVEPPAVTTIFD